jgi:SAM-dependent methyltransferase
VREKVPAIADLRGRPTLYAHWLLLTLTGRGTFVFQGRDYRYFHHLYNATWTNERAVEVPIVRRAIEEAREARLLEIGNVLGHYFRLGHDVVDKYESGAGILNRDIVDFRPQEPYDLIVSISTLEHVGWDEDDRDPGKISRAVEHIRTLLAPGGRAIVTLPFGYNPHLDELVAAGALDVDREHFLLRLGQCEWREVDKADLGRPAYGRPFPGANGLMIGVIERAVGRSADESERPAV